MSVVGIRSQCYGLLIAGLVALAGCSAGSDVIQPASGDRYQQGQKLYNEHCASCHGYRGEGQFPKAPLKPDPTGRYGAPPHNQDGHTWHHPDQVLIEITKNGLIVTGFYDMPAFGSKLTDSEIRTVLAYIKTWWKPEQISVQATQTARKAAQK